MPAPNDRIASSGAAGVETGTELTAIAERGFVSCLFSEPKAA